MISKELANFTLYCTIGIIIVIYTTTALFTDTIKKQNNQIIEQNNQIIEQLSRLEKKNALVWNEETKKVETTHGRVWEIWELILKNEICVENFN